MAVQKSGSTEISPRLLASLLREREAAPRAALIAQHATELLPGAAAVIYLIEDPQSPNWTAKAIVGELRLEDNVVPLESGALGVVAEQRKPVLFLGSKLTREDYSHLHMRRTLMSLACLPIAVDEELIGALEVVTFDAPMDAADLATLAELVELTGPALSSAGAYEQERNSNLQSIARLAQLYDLEKVFNSTLEMDDLLPIITSKFLELLEVQAVNLWMVKDEDELLLINRAGEDPTLEVGASQKSGEGAVAEVSDSGEPKVIDDAEDEYLARRNQGVSEGTIFTLVAVPLVAKEVQVGVVEAINKRDGTPFDEDDLFLLNSMAEAAAGALNNAGLLQAERKVEILETLVTVSKEITSTLNLDGVLQTVVNGTKAVVPYDRAAVALEQRGKLQVKAVSGLDQIRLGDVEVTTLRNLLEWATVSNDEIHVTQRGDEIDSPREETRAKFAEYFQQTEMRAFYAIPLLDDQGRVGILSFESRDPDFLTEAHLEMIRVLAAQVTVALRNAELYKEVPFIGVIGPLMQRKKRFMALEKSRRALLLTVGAVAVLFLVFSPIPLRLSGEAAVAPQNTAEIQPELEGVVKSVYVREGDAVKKGTVLADLDDWDYRSALAAAEAKYRTATADMNRALSANDGTEAGVQRAQADFWASELSRARERLERVRLRSPIDGVVATPHVESFVGRHLAKGDTFAQVVNTSGAMVDVAIDQDDLALLRPGESAAIKLESFPTKTFKGIVTIVSPKSESTGDERVFFARVSVPNPDGKIRAGMQGRGKVKAGWRPAGYVLLRGPLMWIWSKLWSWFGW